MAGIPGMHQVAASSTALSRGSLMVLSQLFCSHSCNMSAYRLGSLAESHPILPPFLYGGEGSSFPGLASPNDTVNSESVVGIQTGEMWYGAWVSG